MQEPIFEKAQSIIRDFITGSYQDLTVVSQEDKHRTLTNFLVAINKDYRLYTLYNDTDALKVWDEVRQSEFLTDTVLKLNLYLRCRLNKEEINALEEAIKEAVSSLAVPHLSDVLMDSVLRERLPSRSFLEKLFEGDGWLLPLYVVSLTPLVEVIGDA